MLHYVVVTCNITHPWFKWHERVTSTIKSYFGAEQKGNKQLLVHNITGDLFTTKVYKCKCANLKFMFLCFYFS